MTSGISQCAFCVHFNAQDRTRNVCKAFPAGIPHHVLWGPTDHRKPVEGDNGVQFEPKPGYRHPDEVVGA